MGIGGREGGRRWDGAKVRRLWGGGRQTKGRHGADGPRGADGWHGAQAAAPVMLRMLSPMAVGVTVPAVVSACRMRIMASSLCSVCFRHERHTSSLLGPCVEPAVSSPAPAPLLAHALLSTQVLTWLTPPALQLESPLDWTPTASSLSIFCGSA